MLSNIGKLLERIIADKLDDFLEDDKTIPANQFGFRPEHSTMHATLRLHSDINLNLRRKRCTVACAMDLEKAFDSVWPAGLIFKTIAFGLPPNLIKIFQSFLSDRKIAIKLGDKLSELFPMHSGVPQGSITGPKLFNLYLADFPLQNMDEEGNSMSVALQYADDTIVYAHDNSPENALRKIQTHLVEIQEYLNSWGIAVNGNKSELICFRNAAGKGRPKTSKESKGLKLNISNATINVKDKIKYLGLNFNNLLKTNTHVKIALKKAIGVHNMMRPLLKQRYFSVKTKLLIYKQSIRPILTYGSPIWFSVSPSVAQQLEKFERLVLRNCTGLHFRPNKKRYRNSTLYEAAGITPLLKYSIELSKKFLNKIPHHENILLREALLENSNASLNDYYLSPFALINDNNNELLDTANNNIDIPKFYNKEYLTTPQNRG